MKAKNLLIIISILLITDLTVLLNIPFLRQILGFLFLTLLPGLLILQILKLNKIGYTEKFILSVGLSISFLMFFGLLLNDLSLSLGYLTPLSTIPLLISFNIALIVLATIVSKVNKKPFFSLSNLDLATSEKEFLVIPVLFPALSIFGMHVMNTINNNIVLIFLLFLIPIYVAFVCLFNHKFPKRMYPVVIFLISISLLLLLPLRSSHLMGSDTHLEYYFFQLAFNTQHWQIFEKNILDACLCITILPTIYQSLLSINSEYLFKILYPLLFSVSPLVIYVISKKYIGCFYSFLVSFFFMSQIKFLNTVYHARTDIAILFFALAIMILFHDGISKFNKKVLFIIFAFSVIISHYSTAYIFFFVLLFSWIWTQILPKLKIHEKFVASSENSIAGDNRPNLLQGEISYKISKGAPQGIVPNISQSQPKKSMTMVIVLLFFTMLFFWYGQITEAPFTAGVNFVSQTFANLNQFFLLESRGSGVTEAFGQELPYKGIPYKIHFALSWLIIALIVIGVLFTIVKYYKRKTTCISISDPDYDKINALWSKNNTEYFAFALVCTAILVLSVIFPYLSKGYDLGRLYFQMLVVLSPFVVIGDIIVAKFLRFKHYGIILLILMVLIPYFMCNIGVMYQIFNVPKNIILNSEGTEYDRIYVHDQEHYGAMWLRNNGEPNIKIYTTTAGGARLLSQGCIRWYDCHSLLERDRKINGYIYLRYYDVIANKLLDRQSEEHNVPRYKDKVVRKTKIYDNGGSEVYL